jgi:hypothetical protein
LRFKASLGKQFQETQSRETLHKNPAGGVTQGEGPEFKPQYRKKKQKKDKTGEIITVRQAPKIK